MKLSTRIFIAAAVFLVDASVFFLPLGALFLAYVILARPRWFLDWLYEVYELV